MQQLQLETRLSFFMRTTLMLFIMIALWGSSFGQVYIEPFAGYQADMNNKNFNLFNTGLQLAYKKGKRYEVIFQLQKSWPVVSGSTDSSFTLNANLPLYRLAAKQLRPSSITAGIGNRIKILGRKTGNSLFAKVYTGFIYQRIAVNYQYDKTNYTVLNPDKTLSATGLFLSAGLEYMRQLKTGRLFGELNFCTPPITGKIKYPYSFNLMAPFSLNIGYSILLKNK